MTDRLTEQEWLDTFGDDIVGMYVERWQEYQPEFVQEHPTFRVWKSLKDQHTSGTITMYQLWVDDCVAFLEYCDSVLGEKPPYYGIGTRDADRGFVPGNIFYNHHRSKKTV